MALDPVPYGMIEVTPEKLPSKIELIRLKIQILLSLWPLSTVAPVGPENTCTETAGYVLL